MATAPTTHTYQDAYLKAHVTPEREARAVTQVATFGSFDAAWAARLVVLRAYTITCLECQAAPDDLFAQKLKHYRPEWDAVLQQAQDAAAGHAIAPQPWAFLSIPLERA